MEAIKMELTDFEFLNKQITPEMILTILDKNKGYYYRVYNTRTFMDKFAIHKTPNSYLVRDSHEIFIFPKEEKEKIINKIKHLHRFVNESNYLNTCFSDEEEIL